MPFQNTASYFFALSPQERSWFLAAPTRLAFLFLVFCWTHIAAAQQQTVFLWDGEAPGAVGEEPKDRPMMQMWKVESANPRPAVLVIPGGGYGGIAMGHEGDEIARWFNSLGVTAFVLEYRHAGKGYGFPAPILDARRAMRLIRSNADEWNVITDRIGVIGFSAGGHLASTLGTHFTTGKEDAKDEVERVSCRPDFMVLCYPVIAMSEPHTHKGSQRNLLGDTPDAEIVDKMSTYKHVRKNTPPTFLFHTTADKAVPPKNSVQFYLALVKAGVPAELHIYEKGRHGLGLAQSEPAVSSWPGRLAAWMRGRGINLTN